MQEHTSNHCVESAAPVQKGVLVYLFKLNGQGQIATMLLLRRAENQKDSIISGKIKHGETPLDAALRETREETGNNPVSIFNTGLTEFIKYQRYMLKAHLFTGIIAYDAAITLNQEHIGYAFVPVPMAEEQLEYPEQKENFKRCLEVAITLLNTENPIDYSINSNIPPDYQKNHIKKRTNAPCMPERIGIFNN